ncbi:MAG: tyrosine-type recombinase/integrase [Deltaproteobacteria bacterium]|nr:tyrosine-type recombinase/integrase [Deltaproteobacteria bacterium]
MAAETPGWTRRPLGDAKRKSTDRGETRITGDGPLLDPASAYLAELGAGSRRTMREALDKLARLASDGRCDLHELPWHLLRIEHTAALRTRLCSILAPATANKHMAALRGVLKQCWKQGRISADEYRRITDLPTIRGEARRRGVILAAEDYARLAGVCAADAGPAGARDEALLALLRGSSLRRAEAVALDRADYDAEAGGLAIRDASGRSIRRVAPPAHARRALERWLAIRGDEPGPLFNPVNKGGRIERRRLSEQAIYIACQKRASEAGLPPTSPEDLRRSFSEA